MRTIRPLRDYILLRRTKADNTSAGGLFIPDNAKRKSGWGEVLAVGPGLPLKDSAGHRPIDPALKPGAVGRSSVSGTLLASRSTSMTKRAS